MSAPSGSCSKSNLFHGLSRFTAFVCVRAWKSRAQCAVELAIAAAAGVSELAATPPRDAVHALVHRRRASFIRCVFA
jgi:hypothetical protein